MAWCRIPGDPEVIFGKFKATESSYSLYLTDLSQVWQEEADHAMIIAKADRLQSLSIDVSSNTKFLLNCLSEVIYDQSSGDIIYFRRDVDNIQNGLAKLEITKDLQPLPEPLKWTFDLGLAGGPQSKVIMGDFVYGLLGTVQVLATKMSYLYEVIEQKDYHLKMVTDVMINAGGSYNPRLHKAEFQPFNQEEFDSKTVECVKNCQVLADKALTVSRKYWNQIELGEVPSTVEMAKPDEQQNDTKDRQEELPASKKNSDIEWDPISVSRRRAIGCYPTNKDLLGGREQKPKQETARDKTTTGAEEKQTTTRKREKSPEYKATDTSSTSSTKRLREEPLVPENEEERSLKRRQKLEEQLVAKQKKQQKPKRRF